MANKKASGRHQNYYKNQFNITIRHKQAGLNKRQNRLEKWIMAGVNKKGKKVLTLEERRQRATNRASARKILREKRISEARENRRFENKWLPNRDSQHSHKKKVYPSRDEEVDNIVTIN